MKLAICTLLVLLSGVASAADSAAGWKYDPDWKLDTDLKFNQLAGGMKVITAPPVKCYFIRMTRPVDASADASPKSPRFIPLQSRVADIVTESVCSSGGELLRAVR